MKGKRGLGLSAPLTISASFLGIIFIMVAFTILISFFPEPKNNIEEMEVNTYGDLFMINYMGYEARYSGQLFPMSELLVMYKDNPNDDLKNLIEQTTSGLLINTLSLENPCFTIRFDGVKQFSSSWSCDDNKIKAEVYLPYKNNVLTVSIEGS